MVGVAEACGFCRQENKTYLIGFKT